MRYIFAGDRKISCNILSFLISKGYPPLALLVSEGRNESHSQQLIELSGVSDDFIFKGKKFADRDTLSKLKSLNPDYIIGIHFPYIIPKEVLIIPKIGFLNLHPAYLPFNKGWHTPSWAILDKTPFGATLHFMSQELDKGDIIHQKQMEVYPEDTADTLYQRVLQVEEEVFYETFDDLIKLNPRRIPQRAEGTSHVKKDLKTVQQIEMDKLHDPEVLIDRLRALTTNSTSEAAFFIKEGKKIGIQVRLFEFNE